MNVHVFTGPTITVQAVRDRVPDAVVHPPVRHGELLALAPRPGDTVAIIDGVFFRTGAVRHKELMHIIQQGVEVWGASSMGALRAAELDAFGMRGIGTVYGLFARREIIADDEVAVMHADADSGYRPMNEALVAVRVAAGRARKQGIVTADEERLLIAAAKRLFFPDRSYPRIIASARADGLSEAAAARFAEHVPRGGDDIKREDAELLLGELGRALAAPRARRAGQLTVPRMAMTSFLCGWIRSTPTASVDGEPVSDMAALTACQLFAADYPAFHHAVLLRELVRGELGSVPADDDPATWQRLACDAASRRGLIPAAPQEFPESIAGWVSETERAGPVPPAIAAALVRSFRWAPNVRVVEPLVEALAGTEAWARAQHQVVEAKRLNAQLAEMRSSFNPHYISDLKLHTWLTRRWATGTAAGSLRLAMLDRGFSSNADLRARAAQFLPLDAVTPVAPWTINPSRAADPADARP